MRQLLNGADPVARGARYIENDNNIAAAKGEFQQRTAALNNQQAQGILTQDQYDYAMDAEIIAYLDRVQNYIGLHDIDDGIDN